MGEPRPLRRPLDGGYRKTPIFYPEPSLYPKFKNSNESSEGVAKSLQQWLGSFFFSIISTQADFKDLPKSFLEDRKKFAGSETLFDFVAVARPYLKANTIAEFKFAEQMLGDKSWILDTETLSLVDLGVAMLALFTVNFIGKNWLKDLMPSLYEHMNRVFKTVNFEKTQTMSSLTPEEAVEVLKKHQSDELPDDFKSHSSSLPIKLGQRVTIIPMDMGKIPVTGTLIRSTVDETVVSYKDENFGTTSIIHFPVIGFLTMPESQ
ncbi:MAG: hypothetical protein EXX96DRAFT_609150 [Benjaminiella poitrasii]|nr:MAG: hypothetical protein EXX96DRAFT_609150 [Benjaminiella poitrasii]